MAPDQRLINRPAPVAAAKGGIMDETVAVVMLTIIFVVGGFALWAAGFIVFCEMEDEK
jgi:hypothetical protein